MNFYVIVLPMKKEDGSVNRQMYAFTDLESAKQSFHSNCGKYFKSADLKMASVCIIDDFCNHIMSDYWQAEETEASAE